MNLIGTHLAIKCRHVTCLRLLEVERCLLEHCERVETFQTSGKGQTVIFGFCDQVFGEMELDGQDIGLGATQIFVSFKLWVLSSSCQIFRRIGVAHEISEKN